MLADVVQYITAKIFDFVDEVGMCPMSMVCALSGVV